MSMDDVDGNGVAEAQFDDDTLARAVRDAETDSDGLRGDSENRTEDDMDDDVVPQAVANPVAVNDRAALALTEVEPEEERLTRGVSVTVTICEAKLETLTDPEARTVPVIEVEPDDERDTDCVAVARALLETVADVHALPDTDEDGTCERDRAALPLAPTLRE